MSKLLRHFSPGQTYAITCCTHERIPILFEHFNLFQEALKNTKKGLRFDVSAWAILPDHFHMVITPDDCTPSDIMHRLKLSFSSRYRKAVGLGSGSIWQRRYWDHVVRDEKDYRNQIDYIHYNPVKHGLTSAPRDWEHSSIHEYADLYPEDWGVREELVFDGEFGE